MNREFILSFKHYYKVPNPYQESTLIERKMQINRTINGDLRDPWSRQELHSFLDEMINKLGKAVENLDDDPR